MVHKIFVHELKTVNSTYRCWKGYWNSFRKWGQFWKAAGSFCTMPSHSATEVKCNLLNCSMMVIRYPPYSPDHMPANSPPKTENSPQKKKDSGCQGNETAKTNSSSVDTFHDWVVKFFERSKSVLQSRKISSKGGKIELFLFHVCVCVCVPIDQVPEL